jgi:hypothetical protein
MVSTIAVQDVFLECIFFTASPYLTLPSSRYVLILHSRNFAKAEKHFLKSIWVDHEQDNSKAHPVVVSHMMLYAAFLRSPTNRQVPSDRKEKIVIY